MNRETLSQAVSQIDPEYLTEALDFSPANPARQGSFRRFAACACLVLLAAATLFTTAFAASETFRQAVISVLYPRYHESELREIGQGHRTGSFDPQDTLLSFPERFDREHPEPGIRVKNRDGFSYSLALDAEDRILAAVDTGDVSLRLLVTMECQPYEDTPGLWQVLSYQILNQEQAETLLAECRPCAFE